MQLILSAGKGKHQWCEAKEIGFQAISKGALDIKRHKGIGL